MRLLALTAILLAAPAGARAGEVLVARGSGSVWRYNDAAPPAGQDWTAPGFADHGWKSGPAPLGFGEDDLHTRLDPAPRPDQRLVTAYFRRTFVATRASSIQALELTFRRDDGFIVYLNGQEILRSNMPLHPPTARTRAARTLDGQGESQVHTLSLRRPFDLREGSNLLAVEVHQSDPASSDLTFDLAVAAVRSGQTAPQDPREEAEAALRAHAPTHAERVLASVAPTDVKLATIFARLGLQLAEDLEQPARGLALLEKAYAAAPADLDIVQAYIRGRVLARRGLAVTPVKRSPPATIPAQLSFIARAPKYPDDTRLLSRQALQEDLDVLELYLENCFSYLERVGADHRAALDALRASLADQTPIATFLVRLQRFLTIFGDIHTRVAASSPSRPRGRVPLRFLGQGQRVFVIKDDRSDFLRATHPYVVALDGMPVADWIAASALDVTRATAHWRHAEAVAGLASVEALRHELGLAPGDSVRLTLESRDRRRRAEVAVPLTRERAASQPWPPAGHKRLGDVGYLRLTEMTSDAAFLDELDERMRAFADTRALVIDVRDNGGGSQDALRRLLPYLMRPEDPLKVINLAAYRLPVVLPHPSPEGFLPAYRGLRPVTAAVWTDDEKAVIRNFLASWKPTWSLPAGKFSDWHVMGVRHSTNPKAFFYDRKVAVLSDEQGVSATDNFLGAFKGHRNVVLMGRPSAGASGRMQDYRLPNSEIPLVMSQMASFAAAGHLYDGRGVHPDVLLPVRPEDTLRDRGDSVLQAALARLRPVRRPQSSLPARAPGW